MKACQTIHPYNLERGDVVLLEGEDSSDVVIVGSVSQTANFGWVIQDNDYESYYIDGYDKITLLKDSRGKFDTHV